MVKVVTEGTKIGDKEWVRKGRGLFDKPKVIVFYLLKGEDQSTIITRIADTKGAIGNLKWDKINGKGFMFRSVKDEAVLGVEEIDSVEQFYDVMVSYRNEWEAFLNDGIEVVPFEG